MAGSPRIWIVAASRWPPSTKPITSCATGQRRAGWSSTSTEGGRRLPQEPAWPAWLERPLTHHIARLCVAADEEIILLVAGDRATHLARAPPHHLRVVAHRLECGIILVPATNTPEQALLLRPISYHLIEPIGAGGAHEEVFALAIVGLAFLAIMHQPINAREVHRPALGVLGEPRTPVDRTDADRGTLAIVHRKHGGLLPWRHLGRGGRRAKRSHQRRQYEP